MRWVTSEVLLLVETPQNPYSVNAKKLKWTMAKRWQLITLKLHWAGHTVFTHTGQGNQRLQIPAPLDHIHCAQLIHYIIKKNLLMLAFGIKIPNPDHPQGGQRYCRDLCCLRIWSENVVVFKFQAQMDIQYRQTDRQTGLIAISLRGNNDTMQSNLEPIE